MQHAMASLPQFRELNSFHGHVNYLKAFHAAVHSHPWAELQLVHHDSDEDVGEDLRVIVCDSNGFSVQVEEILSLALGQPLYDAPGHAKPRPVRLCTKAAAARVMQSVQPHQREPSATAAHRPTAELLQLAAAAPLRKCLRHEMLRLASFMRLPEQVQLEVPRNLLQLGATASPRRGIEARSGMVMVSCTA